MTTYSVQSRDRIFVKGYGFLPFAKNMSEATGDLIGNKIAVAVAKSYDGKITKVSKNSQQHNSETVTNEHDKEIPKERHISPEKRKEIIDDSRLK